MKYESIKWMSSKWDYWPAEPFVIIKIIDWIDGLRIRVICDDFWSEEEELVVIVTGVIRF